MQKKQNLLETAQKARVATLETCKELNWQYPTEKVWAKFYYNSGIILIDLVTQTEIQHIKEIKDIIGKAADFIAIPEVICPAPSFEEIWEKLPKNLQGNVKALFFDLDCISEIGYATTHIVNSRVYCPDYGIEIEKKNHLSEAALLLYLQLKKENLLP